MTRAHPSTVSPSSARCCSSAAPSPRSPVPRPRSAAVTDPASVVNPFLGTSNGGNTFPGADVPFGMVQWSPDTNSRPQGGGYAYADSTITGFSLTHLSGPGCDGGASDVPILPTTGAVNGTATSTFSHANESANAGYYKVGLGNGVTTELTATTRSGMAKFTFPSTTQANLLFKLSHRRQLHRRARRSPWSTPARSAARSPAATSAAPARPTRSTSTWSSTTRSPATAPSPAATR